MHLGIQFVFIRIFFSTRELKACLDNMSHSAIDTLLYKYVPRPPPPSNYILSL